jgi:hypothetical protein
LRVSTIELPVTRDELERPEALTKSLKVCRARFGLIGFGSVRVRARQRAVCAQSASGLLPLYRPRIHDVSGRFSHHVRRQDRAGWKKDRTQMAADDALTRVGADRSVDGVVAQPPGLPLCFRIRSALPAVRSHDALELGSRSKVENDSNLQLRGVEVIERLRAV